MSSGYYLIIPAFTAGWYAHWYFKMRPFSKYVERKAVELQEIVNRIKAKREAK